MTKSLFTDDFTYSKEALSLAKEIDRFLSRIFKEYIGKGYSPRDVGSIAFAAVSGKEAENLILLGIQKRKEEKNKDI